MNKLIDKGYKNIKYQKKDSVFMLLLNENKNY